MLQPRSRKLSFVQRAASVSMTYLDTLRWVLIAVALGGIAVMIYTQLDDWKRRLAALGLAAI